jgi:hypothetical protein
MMVLVGKLLKACSPETADSERSTYFACRLFTTLLARRLSKVCSQLKPASGQSYHRLRFGSNLELSSYINRF